MPGSDSATGPVPVPATDTDTGGYRFHVAGPWLVGIGLAATTEWTYSGEDGDFGRYDYVQRSPVPSLQIRLIRARKHAS